MQAPDLIEARLRRADVQHREFLAFAGARQAASDAERDGIRPDLERERVARPHLEALECGRREEEAVAKQRERAGVLGLRLAEQRGRKQRSAEDVDADDAQRGEPGRRTRHRRHRRLDLDDRARRVDLGQRSDARIQLLVEADPPAADREVGLPEHMAHRAREFVERGGVDQVDGVAERHADRDRDDLHDRPQRVVARVAAGQMTRAATACGCESTRARPTGAERLASRTAFDRRRMRAYLRAL